MIKLHYFDQDEADPADFLLRAAKDQGYVPQTCLLGGLTVMSEMNGHRDPCAGCHCNRSKCQGRPEQYKKG